MRVWLVSGGSDQTKYVNIYSILAVYTTLTLIGVIFDTISKIYLSSAISENIDRKIQKNCFRLVPGWSDQTKYVNTYLILAVYISLIWVILDTISKIYLSSPIYENIKRKMQEIRVWLVPGWSDKTKSV